MSVWSPGRPMAPVRRESSMMLVKASFLVGLTIRSVCCRLAGPSVEVPAFGELVVEVGIVPTRGVGRRCCSFGGHTGGDGGYHSRIWACRG